MKRYHRLKSASAKEFVSTRSISKQKSAGLLRNNHEADTAAPAPQAPPNVSVVVPLSTDSVVSISQGVA